MGKMIVIGGPKISGIALAALLGQYEKADLIAFGTIGRLDEPMKTNPTFNGTISEESYQRLRNFSVEANKAGESFKRMAETLNSIKEPLENEPSKFISKPLHNYKRR